MHRWLLVSAILALAPLRAAALDDLTGTYEGKLSCEGANGTENFRSSSDIAVFVDDANDGSAFLYVNNIGYFHVAIVSPSGAPDSGRLGGPSCGFTFAAGGQLFQAAVRAKDGSDK